jgi:hypothetical protein
MRELSDDELQQVLFVVAATAPEHAPAEYEDDFEDYRELARELRRLPGDPLPEDPSAAGLTDVSVFLGIGLVLLGRVALTVVDEAAKAAANRGFKAVRQLFAGRSKAERDEVTDALVAQVVTVVRFSPGVPEQQRLAIIRAQVAALEEAVRDPS